MASFKSLLTALWLPAIVVGHEHIGKKREHAKWRCSHDVDLPVDTLNRTRAFQEYGHSRSLQAAPSSNWAPIRIVAEYFDTADALMTPQLTQFVQGRLVPAALSKWQSLLSTRTVQGPLYASRQCSRWYTSPDGVPKCGGYSSSLPTCRLGPGDRPVTIDASKLGPDVYYPGGPSGPPASMSAGAGWPNADTVIFFSTRQTSTCGSAGSGVLAYANSCMRDQLDRPIVGFVNLCPGSISTAEGGPDFDFQLGVVVHEIGHSLGFDGGSWPLFRRPDGTPRTPRNPQFPFDVADAFKVAVTCQGQTITRSIASLETIAYFDERGMACSYPNGVAGRSCVGKFVTETALAAVRDFTGCPSMNGVEIEGQDTSPCTVQASHLEQTRWNTDLMCPYAQHILRVSPVTLAVLQDSGWYRARFENADGYRPGLHWGYKQGCDWALGKCVEGGAGRGSPPHYFTSDRDTGSGNAVCTVDRKAIGYADVSDTANPPQPFQYFPGSPRRGGTLPSVFDFCPAVQAYSNLMCESPGDSFGSTTAYGATFGPGSMCLDSSLVRSGMGAGGMGASCYAFACTSLSSLTITLGTSGMSVACEAGSGGAAKSAAGFSGTITCPDPAAVCGPVTKFGAGAPPPPPALSASSPASPAPQPSSSASATSQPWQQPSASASAASWPQPSASSSASSAGDRPSASMTAWLSVAATSAAVLASASASASAIGSATGDGVPVASATPSPSTSNWPSTTPVTTRGQSEGPMPSPDPLPGTTPPSESSALPPVATGDESPSATAFASDVPAPPSRTGSASALPAPASARPSESGTGCDSSSGTPAASAPRSNAPPASPHPRPSRGGGPNGGPNWSPPPPPNGGPQSPRPRPSRDDTGHGGPSGPPPSREPRVPSSSSPPAHGGGGGGGSGGWNPPPPPSQPPAGSGQGDGWMPLPPAIAPAPGAAAAFSAPDPTEGAVHIASPGMWRPQPIQPINQPQLEGQALAVAVAQGATEQADTVLSQRRLRDDSGGDGGKTACPSTSGTAHSGPAHSHRASSASASAVGSAVLVSLTALLALLH